MAAYATQLHHTKPTIKIYVLYYKYDAIADVIYYNPQSILVSFHIIIEVFSAQLFLV